MKFNKEVLLEKWIDRTTFKNIVAGFEIYQCKRNIMFIAYEVFNLLLTIFTTIFNHTFDLNRPIECRAKPYRYARNIIL